MSFNRLMPCLFVLMVLAAAAVSASPFVLDGRLLVADSTGQVVARDLPVEPLHAFGTAEGQVLFTVQHIAPPANADVAGGEIDLWTAADGNAYQLTSGEMVLGALWSDAIDRIVYWTQEKKIHLVDLQGGAREELQDNAITPALSPDGLELAYVLTPATWSWDAHSLGFEIHVRNLADGEDRVILRGSDAHELIWTPDGRSVLFQSSGSGVTSLWRVDAAGGGEGEQLTNRGLWTAKSPFFVKNPSRNTDVHWSDDGRRLLFGATYSEAGEITVIEFDKRYRVLQALDLTSGRFPLWRDNATVLVPRPDVADVPTKSQPTVRLAEFPVESIFARSQIDVAGAPEKFEKPAALTEEVIFPDKAVSKYRYPLHSSAGHPYTGFYDNNGGGGVLDWQCGGFTYNGHKGTDIGVAGWWVYAGAYGNLYSWNDGCPTIGYVGSSCGGGFGNYIKLSHGSSGGRNWYTTYAHFTNGTVIAANHSCGNRVGVSGSSGNSSGYHLHFQVDAYGHPNDDPFSGSCSGPVSYWCNQNGGYPTSSCC